MIKFKRTDLTDGSVDFLTLVTVDGGRTFFAECLGRYDPHVVEQTTASGEFLGLYDLDGEDIGPALGAHASWAPVSDAPEDVVLSVLEGWASGLSTVEILR